MNHIKLVVVKYIFISGLVAALFGNFGWLLISFIISFILAETATRDMHPDNCQCAQCYQEKRKYII